MPQDTSTIAMTYAELARRLKIKPASAKRLVYRHPSWLRVRGNEGVTLVHVPSDFIRDIPDDVAADNTPDITDDITGDVTPDVSSLVTADLLQQVAHLEGLVGGLRGQVEAEQRRASAEQQRADAAEARVADIGADREAWKRQAQRSLWSRLFGGSN